MKLRIGEPNLGAVVGAATGAVGGLVALGIAPALLTHKAEYLIAWPTVAILSWLISALVGWLIGGQLGPRLEPRLGERNGSAVGGIIGGLAPATAIALWSWHSMVTPANPRAATSAWSYDDVEFSAPAKWSVEKIEGGVLIQCPKVEGEWPAGLFLQILEEPQPLSLTNALVELALNLKSNKQQFLEVRRVVSEPAHGLPACLIEYTCVQDQTPLTQWEALFNLGGGKRVRVEAVSSTARWTEYQPAFGAFLNSLRTGGTGSHSP